MAKSANLNEIISELKVWAIIQHEAYTELQDAGFSKDEALKLVIAMVQNNNTQENN